MKCARSKRQVKEMLRIAVVEDEDIYADRIKSYLKKYAKEKEIVIQTERFRDGDEIVENYRDGMDIIFMDIQMKFMDGMTAAEQIRKLDQKVIIIFITNMIEYAIQGYEVAALDYVVKPVNYISFARKMDRAVSMIKTECDYISIPTEEGMKRLELELVLFVEVRDHTLIYHTETEEIQAKGRTSMRNLEEKLEKYGFFRCSNCALVNLKRVDAIEDGRCKVGNKTVQISRTRKKAFMNVLVKYISGGENRWI